MPPYGFSVTKKVTWRGRDEEFSNVYHYIVDPVLASDTAHLTAMLDGIVAAERPAFGSVVTFVRGRVWGPTNQGQAASVTRVVKDYSGVGTQSGTQRIPFELTLVCQYFIGRNPATQRKRFLRKYLHIAHAGSTDAESARLGNDTITTNMRNIGLDYLGRVDVITVLGFDQKLCAPDGTLFDAAGGNPVVLDHLRTRQFVQ